MAETDSTVGSLRIAILSLRYLQLRSSFGRSLSNLVALLRQQLLVYHDLNAWLNSHCKLQDLETLHDFPDLQQRQGLECTNGVNPLDSDSV